MTEGDSHISGRIISARHAKLVEIAPNANPRVRGIHGQPAQFKQGMNYESSEPKSSTREGEEEEDEDENADIWEPAPSEMSIVDTLVQGLECR